MNGTALFGRASGASAPVVSASVCHGARLRYLRDDSPSPFSERRPGRRPLYAGIFFPTPQVDHAHPKNLDKTLVPRGRSNLDGLEFRTVVPPTSATGPSSRSFSCTADLARILSRVLRTPQALVTRLRGLRHQNRGSSGTETFLAAEDRTRRSGLGMSCHSHDAASAASDSSGL